MTSLVSDHWGRSERRSNPNRNQQLLLASHWALNEQSITRDVTRKLIKCSLASDDVKGAIMRRHVEKKQSCDRHRKHTWAIIRTITNGHPARLDVKEEYISGIGRFANHTTAKGVRIAGNDTSVPYNGHGQQEHVTN